MLSNFFPSFERTISVGLNPEVQVDRNWEMKHMCAIEVWNRKHSTTQHGSVRVKRKDGLEVQVGMVVDKPRRLKNLKPDLLDSMFSQIKTMGFEPLALEVFVNDTRRVYEVGNAKPVLVQRRL